MRCTNCNAELGQGANVCAVCGAPVQYQYPPDQGPYGNPPPPGQYPPQGQYPQPPAPGPKKKLATKWIILIVAAAAAAVILILGFTVFGWFGGTALGQPSLSEKISEANPPRVAEALPERTPEPTPAPLPTAEPEPEVTPVAMDVLDPLDFINIREGVTSILDYDYVYQDYDWVNEGEEHYTGYTQSELPYTESEAECFSYVYPDYISVSYKYLFSSPVDIEDKVALYDSICATAYENYGANTEGYYYTDTADRTEDLYFDDEMIYDLSDDPYGELEFSRVWDPTTDGLRLVVSLTPNADYASSNGHITVRLYDNSFDGTSYTSSSEGRAQADDQGDVFLGSLITYDELPPNEGILEVADFTATPGSNGGYDCSVTIANVSYAMESSIYCMLYSLGNDDAYEITLAEYDYFDKGAANTYYFEVPYDMVDGSDCEVMLEYTFW